METQALRTSEHALSCGIEGMWEPHGAGWGEEGHSPQGLREKLVQMHNLRKEVQPCGPGRKEQVHTGKGLGALGNSARAQS